MMKKISIILSLFLVSCIDVKPKESSAGKAESRIEVKRETGDIAITSSISMTAKQTGSSIEDFIKIIETEFEKSDFERRSDFSLAQYKRKQFKINGFEGIFYESQFTKVKNKNLSIIVYHYDSIASSTSCFVAIESSRYLDGIYKSGGMLVQYENYLIQIASTCSISKTEIYDLQASLNLQGEYLYCECGGRCVTIK